MSKKERVVPKHPEIYQVIELSKDGKERLTNIFRVRKRIKVDGKWTSRVFTFQSLGEAKLFGKQPFQLEDLHQWRPLAFEEAFQKFIYHKEFEERLAPGTIAGYQSRARHFKFFHGMRMSEINSRVIDVWVNLLLDPQYKSLQQGSRENYDHELVLLSCFLSHYREFFDETFVMPIMKRHRKRLAPSRKNNTEIRYLSMSEEEAFLRRLQQWPTLRDIAIFQLHTGVRVGEAASLQIEDIEFNRGQVHIRSHLYWERFKGGKTFRLKGTKTGPDRTVPLTDECLEMLIRRRSLSVNEKVFGSDRSPGDWLTYRSIQGSYDQAFKKAGLPHRGTHTLRHTFAVRFLEQTKDIHALQRALGHTDLKTTMIYAKYTNDSVRGAFQLFRGGLSDNVTDLVPQLVPKQRDL